MCSLILCAMLAADALESEAIFDFAAAPPDARWKYTTLPGGAAHGGPGGIVLKTPAGAVGKSALATFPTPSDGDFDVVADYELEAAPGAQAFAEPALEAVLSSSVRRVGRLALAAEPGKPARHAAAIGPEAPELYAAPAAGPAAGKAGRLQIQRRGGKWMFSAAPAGSATFETVSTVESGTRSDLKELALSLRGAAAAGAVRFTRVILRGPAPDGVPILETVEGRRIAADFDFDAAAGTLALRTLPPSKRRLSDLVAIAPNPVRPFRARWGAQDSEDHVGPHAKAEKNGIYDVRIDLSSLPPEVKLKAARVVLAGAAAAWSSDPAGPQWRLHVDRTGTASSGRLYLEPAGNLDGALLGVRLDFEDGQTRYAHVVAGPTDPARKVGATPPNTTPATPAVTEWRALLPGGDALQGDGAGWDAQGLALRTVWGGRLTLTHAAMLGVRNLAVRPPADTLAAFEAKLGAPAEVDTAFVKDKEGVFRAVAGTMLGVAGGKVRFKLGGAERTVDLDRFAGVVFQRPQPSARPPARGAGQVRFALPDQCTATGALLSFAEGRATLRTAWSESVMVPWDSVAKLSVLEGRQRFLSDFAPSKVVETPYLDRTFPWRKDTTLAGEPLKLRGQTYAKGLALHSRCVLTYDLAGEYAEFRCKAGFDESVPRLGRVKLRFLGDGKELLVRPDFRADAEPEDLLIKLAGVKEFAVEVDYGPDDDACDRVLLIDARLLRAAE